jgi:dephospho-CoA kinase
MQKVGITGGIGSGKSTICRIFEMLGVPVFQADQEAKHLMDTDPELRGKIRSIFGDDIYLSNQRLTEKNLRQLCLISHICCNN